MSSEYNVPSPLVAPRGFGHYDLPPPSPPPTAPLPPPPVSPSATGSDHSHEDSGSLQALQAQPQRGRVSPFPSRPVQPTHVVSSSRSGSMEGQANVERYRDLYVPRAQQVGRQSTQSSAPGIQIEEPSDDEDDYGVQDEHDSVLGHYHSQDLQQRPQPSSTRLGWDIAAHMDVPEIPDEDQDQRYEENKQSYRGDHEQWDTYDDDGQTVGDRKSVV